MIIKALPGCRDFVETGGIEISHDASLGVEATVNVYVTCLDARCEVGPRRE